MEHKLAKISFLILFALLILGFAKIIKPFAMPAFLALLIVVICNPIYQFFLRLVKEKRYIASFFATLFVAICIITPLGIAVGIIISNISNVIGYITAQLQAGQIALSIDETNRWLTAKAAEFATWLPADFNLRTALVEVLTSAGKTIYQYSPKVVYATANIAGGIILMIIFMFGLFAEGPKIYRTIISLLPLADEHKDILAKEIRFVISGTFLGMIATSVAQGILIGIGFAIVGISNPLVWGLVAVGVTLIPVIGGPLMYLPAMAALFIGGRIGAGVFILIYGVGIVSMIDNVIKPIVMRGKVNVHPLLLALAIIGGGLWLGPIGIICGPLIVVLMLTMIKIYQREWSVVSR